MCSDGNRVVAGVLVGMGVDRSDGERKEMRFLGAAGPMARMACRLDPGYRAQLEAGKGLDKCKGSVQSTRAAFPAALNVRVSSGNSFVRLPVRNRLLQTGMPGVKCLRTHLSQSLRELCLPFPFTI